MLRTITAAFDQDQVVEGTEVLYGEGDALKRGTLTGILGTSPSGTVTMQVQPADGGRKVRVVRAWPVEDGRPAFCPTCGESTDPAAVWVCPDYK